MYTTYSHSHGLILIHIDPKVIVTSPSSSIALCLKGLVTSLHITVVKCFLVAKDVRQIGRLDGPTRVNMGYISCPSSFTSAPVKDKSVSTCSRHSGKKNEHVLVTIGIMGHRVVK